MSDALARSSVERIADRIFVMCEAEEVLKSDGRLWLFVSSVSICIVLKVGTVIQSLTKVRSRLVMNHLGCWTRRTKR